MKTKFYLLLTMMLVSMGAFAQSNEPLEGDVNKDGKVDVADIVKVIDIMQNSTPQPTVTYYWYAGLTLPESTNLADIANESLNAKPTTWTSNPQSLSITNNTGADAYFYYCFPTEWNVVVYDEDKTTEMLLEYVSTYKLNGVEYTVHRMGRLQGEGATQNLYAKC